MGWNVWEIIVTIVVVIFAFIILYSLLNESKENHRKRKEIEQRVRKKYKLGTGWEIRCRYFFKDNFNDVHYVVKTFNYELKKEDSINVVYTREGKIEYR